MRLLSLLAVTTVIGLAACNDDATGVGDCTPTSTKVCMANGLFDPATLTVASGTTVTWQNADDETHSATSNPSNPAACPSFDNSVGEGETTPGVTFSPASAVTCQYYCKIHATPTSGAMRGTIVVQ
jgi:plastocyanin